MAKKKILKFPAKPAAKAAKKKPAKKPAKKQAAKRETVAPEEPEEEPAPESKTPPETPPEAAAPAGLTDEQLAQLASVLRGNRMNVYQVVEMKFGIKVGEEIFTQLQEKHGLFKCENCDTWLDTSEQAAGVMSDWCQGCADDMDAEDEDDE